MAITYPDNLPCPRVSEVQAKERRHLSPQAGVAGPMRTRVLQRDLLQREQAAFIFTFDQAEVFRAWWQDVLIFGGCWFGAHWPLPQAVPDGGYRFRRFVGAPTWADFIPGVGWGVTAVFEVRGLGTPEVIDGGGILCGWDVARSSVTATFTNRNLTAEGGLMPGGYTNIIAAGSGATEGKFYYEVLIEATTGFMSRWPAFGIATNDLWVDSVTQTGNPPITEIGNYGWGLRCSGEKAYNVEEVVFAPPLVAGDIAGIAVDLDAGKLWVSVNGAFVGDPEAGTGEAYNDLRTKEPYPISSSNAAFPSASVNENDAGGKLTARFAESSWTYPAPAGFGAWNVCPED